MSTYGAPYVQWRTEGGGGQLPLGAAPRGAPKRGGKKNLSVRGNQFVNGGGGGGGGEGADCVLAPGRRLPSVRY